MTMIEAIEKSNALKSDVQYDKTKNMNTNQKAKLKQKVDNAFKELFDEKCAEKGFRVLDEASKKIEITDKEVFFKSRENALTQIR